MVRNGITHTRLSATNNATPDKLHSVRSPEMPCWVHSQTTATASGKRPAGPLTKTPSASIA